VDANEVKDKMLSRAALEFFRGAWVQTPTSTPPPPVSIANADLTGLPPTLLHYGACRTLTDDGAAPGRRLLDFKVTSKAHAVPEGQHSFAFGASRAPGVNEAIGRMGQWPRTHLSV
jgi:acetyl esterase/lipase